MRKYLLTALMAALMALLSRPANAQSCQLTGTMEDPAGNPINGTLVMALSNPGQDTSTLRALSIAPQTFPLVNGQLPVNAYVVGNDIIQPSGTYYIVTAYDTAGNTIYSANYYVAGSTFNMGQATPTALTTSQISYQNPAFVNVANTWTTTQSFTNQIISSVATGTPPFSIASTTLVPNLNVDIIGGVTVSGTPSAGQAPIATSATAAAWGPLPGLVGFKVECVNITPVTVSNTTTLSALQTCTIPANDMNASQTFEVEAAGTIGDTASPTFTVSLMLDGTAYTEPSIEFTMAAANSQGWTYRAFFTVLTVGSTGTEQPSQPIWASSASAGGITTNGGGSSNSPLTINTTISHSLGIYVVWGTANSSNTVTSSVITIKRIN